jgi:hypothetical protein
VAIKIKVDQDSETEALAEREGQKDPIKISMQVRKTLDGKIMILDHNLIDIILDTSLSKVITFPKEELSDDIYAIQNSYFKYLVNEGVILPGSIRSGNVFGSLEATYPKPADEAVNASQVVLLSTKNFIDAQSPHLEMQDFIENELEDHLLDPTPEDSTELGEVPEEPKKGSMTPYRIRAYLSGYGYY